MKKIFCRVVCTMAVLSFTGCDLTHAPSESDTVADEIIMSKDDNEPTQYEINFPSYAEIQEQYPEKTVIVWAVPETVYEIRSPFRTREMNAYLDESGSDLAVCFEPITVSDGTIPDPFLTAVKYKLDSGGRIDIISPMNYSEFVFAGLYERLDNYLTAESGRELYGAFPEKLWDGMRINGGIYGLNGSTSYTLSLDWGYYVNSELAKKYGFDVSKPITEQLDILNKVKENEKRCDVFSANVPSASVAVNCADIKEIVTGVYWNENTHSAECVLDNRNFVEKIRLYNELNNNELLVNSGADSGGSFFIMQDSVPGSTAYSGAKTVDVEYGGNVVNAVPVFGSSSSIRNCSVATGICSASENKNKAFELLSLVYTDAYLNDLLTFGIEGEDYNIADGMVDTLINPFNAIRFANDFICHRYYNSSFTAEQYKDVYKNALLHEDMDFVFDGSSLAEEIASVTEVFLSFEIIPAYEKGEERMRDADTILSELRGRLENAGIQKIIDECNRQYEVYKNEKN